MKQLIKNTGLFIFIIAIALLTYGILQDIKSNDILVISGALIILGLIVHVVLNKKFI